MFTLSVLILGLAAITTIVLGGVVFFQRPKQAISRHFFVFVIGVAGWTVSNALFTENVGEQTRFGIALASYGFAAILALNFFLFCHDLALKKYSRKVLIGATLLGIATAVASMVPGIVGYGVDGLTILTHGVGLAGYGAVLLLFFGTGLWRLIHTMHRVRGRVRKQRISIVLLGLSVSAAIGVGCNLILPMFGNYSLVQFGPLGSIVLVVACAYAIVRHSLFDIKLAVSRTTAYILTLGLLAAIYVIATGAISSWLVRYSLLSEQSVTNDTSVISVMTTLGLVFLFQPIKRFFDKFTNNIFYRNRYSRDELYAQLNEILINTTNLRPLLEKVSRLLASTLGATQSFFFVYRDDDRSTTAGSRGHARLPLRDARWLDEVVASKRASELPIIAAHLQDTDEYIALHRFMVSHQLAVVLPLIQGDRIIGYLCLGEQRGGAYSARDRLVLNTVSNELVIAIQNALSIQEVRDLNETLQQRIDEATRELRVSNAQLRKLDEAKDEFISMASHQLRTPLTSIKGYIDMMLEGDAGKITPAQRKFLTEAFMSSERMVHLINDFLSMSRLQTGKFIIEKRPTNLGKLVEQEIESLKVNASGRELSFSLSIGKSIPQLMLDEAKVRQVVMNFADNALYYSPAGSVIKVSLAREGDDVVLKIVDKGIGVPQAEQSRLFSKFFRAANARKQRPDGTGVGLYLAKRVVTEHGGQIIFDSTEGKGSTFGFRLPLKRLGVDDNSDQFDQQPDDN